MTMNNDAMNPITEDDIANYLANTPDFFQRHAELLASVQLNSPHGNRAVSLQERQAEMLREKIKVLELRMMDMIRHGSENMVIAGRLHRWALHLLSVPEGVSRPAAIQPMKNTPQGMSTATQPAGPAPRASTSCGRNSSTAATVTRFARPRGSITFQARFIS